MNITKSATRPTKPAPSTYFTGAVEVSPVIDTAQSERVRAVLVTFQPTARTAWHTHPLGQTLVILEGIARVQVWGGPVVEVAAGDTVWFAPGEKHWHGAGTEGAMTHLAIQEALDGKTAEWMEMVGDGPHHMPRPPWPAVAHRLIDVAMGHTPADTVIRNGRWVNVHPGEIIAGTRGCAVA